ncbi:flagellar biosynthesis protein FlhF [Salimicrobium flavidum]|uniref:Flagellar biosynthesis protein FlhF n=1 Tax=Salimicrobium flavidum TaxID=570947 RepID=A0A1N7IKL2_9BACI|nr:flagellar biosynthesis protein FlhF [Salimicrobium flavidum]SIS37590.1 flagellar biosynthesis protein FlhF [Salimicrobium flavidum]
MKVKKFQAESMPKAMKKVKQEMGTEAVILNSKEVKSKGFLGFFRKKEIEVIAARDPEASKPLRPEVTSAPVEKERTPLQEASGNELLMQELDQLKTLIRAEKMDTSEVKEHYAKLQNQELASEFIEEILSGKEGESLLSIATQEYLTGEATQVPASSINKSKKFLHLIGPTGVGKTTTAAKLAADAMLNEGLSVGFITTDTYRIAAIEQLQTYAKLLDVPMEVAYNIEDYLTAREKMKDKDFVIVDTAGRNYKDPAYVEELRQVIDFRKDAETVLVLSMTSKFQDIESVFNQFSSVPLHSLIFTKMDETGSYGAAISLALKHRIGISYVTKGQSVPDDISSASLSELIEKLRKELASDERSG